jgi:hypothetical protein
MCRTLFRSVCAGIVFCTFLCWAAASLPAQTPLKKLLANKLLLIPGQSVGSIQLGMTRQEVHALLKKPDTSFHYARNKNIPNHHTYLIDTWFEETDEDDQEGIRVIYDTKNIVIQIESMIGSGYTISGVTMKTSVAKFRRIYPDFWLRVYSIGEYVSYNYIAKAEGITFSFGAQDIFGRTTQPRFLIIHKPNTLIIPGEGAWQINANDENPTSKQQSLKLP